MATTLNFKDCLDLPEWQPLSPAPANATAGAALICDLRNDMSRDPNIYFLSIATSFNKYSTRNDEWLTLTSPALAGTFGAGAGAVFVPCGGPTGYGSGVSTTQIQVLSNTLFPAPIGFNQLLNLGDNESGCRIRIIGSGAGKVEERTIIQNTEGRNPLITFTPALTFTPSGNDKFELLSGRVLLFSAAALTAGIAKNYDVATQAVTNINTTNLIATLGTQMDILALDELYVPCNHKPGEGFIPGTGTYDASGIPKRALVAQTTAANTIQGQANSGDWSVLTNEYRNFQIRIVEDTINPLAVNQRRLISSHTAGPSPTYTVNTNWTSTPTASTSKFVIEYPNDVIVLNGVLNPSAIYSYSGGFAPDQAWSATKYAAPSGAHAAGAMIIPSFGLPYMTGTGMRMARHSYFPYFRGTTAVMDRFDLAGSTSGTWITNIPYGNSGSFLPVAGACAVYDGVTNSGMYGYISQNATQRFARYNVHCNYLEPWAYMRYPQSTVTAADRVALSFFMDGETKLSFLNTITAALATFFRVANTR
jgi:hypothetical protein